MIENNKRLQSILDNILDMVNTVKMDLLENDKSHYSYMLEKLRSAQWDLNVVIKIANDKAMEEENGNN